MLNKERIVFISPSELIDKGQYRPNVLIWECRNKIYFIMKKGPNTMLWNLHTIYSVNISACLLHITKQLLWSSLTTTTLIVIFVHLQVFGGHAIKVRTPLILIFPALPIGALRKYLVLTGRKKHVISFKECLVLSSQSPGPNTSNELRFRPNPVQPKPMGNMIAGHLPSQLPLGIVVTS